MQKDYFEHHHDNIRSIIEELRGVETDHFIRDHLLVSYRGLSQADICQILEEYL